MSIIIKNKNLQIAVDPELHREFKIALAKNSKSLKEAVTELIKYYIIQTNVKEQNDEK